jgi:hypothetical protein
MAHRRERPRRKSFKFDSADIVKRVLKFNHDDDTARSVEKEVRVQRYAKFRMWTEGKDWPWPDSSDVPLSDMMEKSLRVQDTLHNAVMSARPPIGSKAIGGSSPEKERAIDRLIDYQVFVEQNGENIIGDLADAFVNDGEFTAFIPWVKEFRETSDAKIFDPIPDETEPIDYFQAIIQQEFGSEPAVPSGADGWDWRVGEAEVSFFTNSKREVERVIKQEVVVYDGPRVIQKEWDEVLYPARAANLQIPGPSNPHGAAHVILVDHPTIDEVRRLHKSGLYDGLTKKDLDKLETAGQNKDNEETSNQKDDLQGVTPAPINLKAASQKTVTRLLCFDIFDINRDGVAEDVVWWVIVEIEALARAKIMTEVYPSNPPRRPLAEESFIPIRGRKGGISLLEMMEGLHDVMKMTLDQTVDSGTLKVAPPWFYRPSGSIKPEIIRLAPGEGYPLQDPQRDVNFPQANFQAETFGINLLTVMSQWQDHLTTIGPLQLGDVPKGKSSALRTVGGMSMVAAQGEARPERILRRFFNGLASIWEQIHELNQNFLPDQKKIRIIGAKDKAEDPYFTIGRNDISGQYYFDFTANVLNTSKAALQQALQSLMGTYVSDLAIQLGIIDAAGIYRLLREFGLAFGQDPDQFIKEPEPGAMKPRIFAEEAIAAIMRTEIPNGEPGEGAVAHLEKIQNYLEGDNLGLLTPPQVEILKVYLQEVAEKAALEQKQQALAQAAQNFGQPAQGGNGTAPGQDATLNAPLQPNELIDESLPGAGGGANVSE